MEKLHEFALRHTVVDIDVLIDLLSQLEEGECDRIVEALCGIANPSEVEMSLPEKGNFYNDNNMSICTRIGYNYVKGEVSFRYTRRDYRRFKTEDDAKKFQETGDYSYGRSECYSTPSEGFPHIAYRDSLKQSKCSVGQWIDEIRRHEKMENQAILSI